MPQIEAIQTELRSAGLDAWLFYDFHHRDPIAARVLGLDAGAMGTRRWFYLIPERARRASWCIASRRVRSTACRARSWSTPALRNCAATCRGCIGGAKKVAMQYSPHNAIPYISLVDAGTVEMVRAQGCKVVSSADLVQKFEASWTAEQYESHLEAGRAIDRVTQEAFVYAASQVRSKSPLTEYDLQQWMLAQFRANGITTDEPPIVAVGPHTADPHYEPRVPRNRLPIREGDLLLLDVWGKLERPGSVYYDITWVGYLGAEVPGKYAKIFAHCQPGA